MKGSTSRFLAVFALLAVLAVPAGLEAQQRGQRRGAQGAQGGRAELEQRVRQRFGQMIRQRLELSEEQGQALSEVMRSFQERRMQLMRDEEATRRRVEALMLEGDDPQGEAQELVARLIQLRESEVGLFREEQEALLEVLTPYQLLQFHAMRDQLNRRVRELRGQPGGPRGPGGGNGPVGMDADGGVGLPIPLFD